jgi:hypothetical protein
MLNDLLIKPVQRVTKYQLLLKDLLKHCQKIGDRDEIVSVEKAIDIMQMIPKTANDMMDVERIQGFDVSYARSRCVLYSTSYLLLWKMTRGFSVSIFSDGCSS